MRKIGDVLFSLIRFELFGGEYVRNVSELSDASLIASVCALAAYHDMAHLVADALGKLSVIPTDEKLANALGKEQLKAIFRAERMDSELNSVSELFEKEKIEFLPLKGAVIRELYPEKWMRTSCDIDVLVRKKDIERAALALCGQLGYTKRAEGEHDVGFMSPSGIHFELHFTLNDESRGLKIFDKVWDYTYRSQEGSYRLNMNEEMFYLYHIAHMEKHVQNGGCGIKPLLDLMFIKPSGTKLLKSNKLDRFAEAAEKLSQMWFNGGSGDEITKELEDYILRAGTYGSMSNAAAVGTINEGSHGKYILYRIFMPYDKLKYRYPILKKHKWLTPFYQVRRWLGLLTWKKFKRSANEIKANNNLSDERGNRVKKLFEELGINQ